MKIGRPTQGLSEAEGRQILKRAFAAAGFRIVEDFPFEEDGIRVSLDGWDPKQRVGYEYLTRESGDRGDFTDDKLRKLVAWMEEGRLRLLLIDGEGNPDREIMEYLARSFLKRLREAEDPTCPG